MNAHILQFGTMIIVLKQGVTEAEVDAISKQMKEWGLTPHVSVGETRTVVGAIGDEKALIDKPIRTLPGVVDCIPIQPAYKLVSRDFQPDDTVIKVGDAEFGGGKVAIIGGPCSVETEEQMVASAKAAKAAGAVMLRGGAYKPRTSPYSFQGLGEEGLKLLKIASEETGLPFVTEVMDIRDLDTICQYADMLQIGARNMQNFNLLKEVGKTSTPVVLKRALSGTIKEWLMSAEYIASEGNRQIILCERGIRTYETATRNTLDLQAIPVLRRMTHLPIIIDPSHAGGKSWLVDPMSKAAVAAGADGLIIEMHNDPCKAWCDGEQALNPEEFAKLVAEVKAVAQAIGKECC